MGNVVYLIELDKKTMSTRYSRKLSEREADVVSDGRSAILDALNGDEFARGQLDTFEVLHERTEQDASDFIDVFVLGDCEHELSEAWSAFVRANRKTVELQRQGTHDGFPRLSVRYEYYRRKHRVPWSWRCVWRVSLPLLVAFLLVALLCASQNAFGIDVAYELGVATPTNRTDGDATWVDQILGTRGAAAQTVEGGGEFI